MNHQQIASRMDELLTVIVQTSPIPSHPSTALLEALFRSFRRVDGLLESRILIVCDGCEQWGEDDSQEVENMKHGKVSSTTAFRYHEHRKQLKEKLHQPPFSSLGNGSIEIVELSERHGSARAIETTFFSSINTPFVMIAQHDNFFVKDVPLRSIIVAMQKNSSWAKSIHFPATATLNYQQKVHKRYGINIEKKRMECDDASFQVIPLVFWYGRTHIGRSDYYREFVFHPNRRATLKTGDHLEELLGESQLRDIREHGMSAHEPYGNYALIFTDTEGNEDEVLYHLSGRRARAIEEQGGGVHGEIPETAAASDSDNHDNQQETMTLGKSNTLDTANNGSWTTSRSCRAVVPGLYLPPIPTIANNDSNAPKGSFKQKCFHCGIKGHSFRFCPDRIRPPETQTIDLS